MKDINYKLGKIDGIFKAFEWVNAKTNHQYSFEISILQGSDTLEKQAELHLKQWYENAIVETQELENWKVELTSTLKRWLFDYVPNNEEGCQFETLLDETKAFNLSRSEARQLFVENLFGELQETLDIVKVIKVNIKTDEWYEACWDDFAIQGEKASIFLHFGDSD